MAHVPGGARADGGAVRVDGPQPAVQPDREPGARARRHLQVITLHSASLSLRYALQHFSTRTFYIVVLLIVSLCFYAEV